MLRPIILAAILTLSLPILEHKVPDTLPQKELTCLHDNVYHEARGESREGMVAVAKVTLNRVGTYANSVCKVVYQKKQFSWTAKKHKKPKFCQECMDAIHIALNDSDFPATHYHNHTVKPKWGLTQVAVIGNHTFYF